MLREQFLLIITGIIGTCWGSFLNAAYYRAQENKSLFYPPSFCPKCKTPIKSCYNLPIVGWLLSKGRCNSCNSPISIHYPLMELAVGLLFLVCYTYTLDPVTACFAGAIISLLTMGAIYDHFYFLLPDVVLNGAPLIALAMACYNGKHTLITACTGGVISAAALYAIKRTGEVFLTRTEKVNGYLKVDSQGITLIDADGKEEHTTWPEFVFTKVIPQGHLVINDIQCPAWQTASGQQKPYLVQDGDLIIYDGSATLGGHPVDLNKGFTVKVEQLKIHRNAMGLGDVRLALPLGILIGFNSGLYEALFFACCTGLAHGLYLRRQDRRLPFGPHLMLGTAYVLASQHGTVPAIKTLLVYLGGK